MNSLALNFASMQQTENSRGFSELGENKQLLIAMLYFRYFSKGILNIINCLKLIYSSTFHFTPTLKKGDTVYFTSIIFIKD